MAFNAKQATKYVKAWVKALRGRGYKQTTGALCRDGKYCCLGVGCSVINRLSPGTIRTERIGNEETSFDGFSRTLPGSAVALLGLRTGIGLTTTNCLANLNDYEELTFKQIADVIESQPKGLFRRGFRPFGNAKK